MLCKIAYFVRVDEKPTDFINLNYLFIFQLKHNFIIYEQAVILFKQLKNNNKQLKKPKK